MALAGTLDKTQSGKAPQDAGATTRRYLCSYVGPASYATGGDIGLLAALGVGKVFVVAGFVLYNGSVILIGYYNPVTDALLVFDMAGAEIAAATNLSGYTAYFEAIAQ
jgi:hypothetical protein